LLAAPLYENPKEFGITTQGKTLLGGFQELAEYTARSNVSKTANAASL
jgi:hypothetical protein